MKARVGILTISLAVLLAGVASLTTLLAGAAFTDDHSVHKDNTVTMFHQRHGNEMTMQENAEHHMNAMSGYHMGLIFHRENADGMTMPHENAMVGHRVDMAEHMRTAGCNGHSH